MAAMAGRARSVIAFVRATAAAIPHTSRSLRRAPGFVAIATLSLGAALGMSTSVFALIDAMTHPNSPYRDVGQLFEVRVFGGARSMPSGKVLNDALTAMPGVEQLVTATDSWLDVEAGQTVSRMPISFARPGFFEMLGVRTRLGRLASLQEAQQQSVALVSDDLWKTNFGNRATIGDAHVSVGDQVYSVIGVLPPHASAPYNASVWIPAVDRATVNLPQSPVPGSTQNLVRYLELDNGIPFVRLRPGVTAKTVQPYLNAVMHQFQATYGGPNDRPLAASLASLSPDPLALRDFHHAMIGAALCVLIIACANVAALMLARGTARRRDYALRLALGASRGDIAREVVFEVAALAVAGSIAGAIIATWGVGLITRATPQQVHWLGFVAPQWSVRVLAMSAIAVVTAVAIAGGLPAWHASRTDPAGTLKDSSGGNTGRAHTRFRWLVIAELALSMTLLVGATLMVKSVTLMARYDFGYDARSLVTASVMVNRYENRPVAETNALIHETLARVRATPGIERAALIADCVFDHPIVTTDRTIEGGRPSTMPRCSNVSTDYFATLSRTIAEGRDFADGDALGDGAVILDQKTARRLFPHESAVGRTLKLGNLASRKPWMTVVGVVRDRLDDFNPYPEMGPDSSEVMFISAPDSSREQHKIVVRAARGAKDVRLTLSRTLVGVLPPNSWVAVGGWTDKYDNSVQEERFLTLIFSLLGAASLVLGAAGLFSVVSYIAGQRMREFAVRIALGATRENVLRLVLREALMMALGGTAIGAGLGMWAGFMLWDKMYGVYPVDVGALAAAEVTLLAVTVLACIVPALRATRADPVDVLRAA
jgi:putative ABC transport system permease protein